MEKTSSFQVKREGEDTTRGVLFFQGAFAGQVEGSVLEGQYRCGNRYLLLTTDDIPYEETLHIFLLDEELRPLDKVSLRQMYHSGLLRDVVAGDERIEFSFFGEERWLLTVHTTAKLFMNAPFSSVKYARLGRHFLELRKVAEG